MASYRSNESWYRTFRRECLCAELQCALLRSWSMMHAQHHQQWSEMHGSRVYGIRAVQLVIPWSLLKEIPLYHAALPCNVGALVTAWLFCVWLCLGSMLAIWGLFSVLFVAYLGVPWYQAPMVSIILAKKVPCVEMWHMQVGKRGVFGA